MAVCARLHPCSTLAGLTAALCIALLPQASADSSLAGAPTPSDSGVALGPLRLSRPLNVCTASIHNAGLSCRGAPAGFSADPLHACPGSSLRDSSFCGYDVDLWRCALLHGCPGDAFKGTKPCELLPASGRLATPQHEGDDAVACHTMTAVELQSSPYLVPSTKPCAAIFSALLLQASRE